MKPMRAAVKVFSMLILTLGLWTAHRAKAHPIPTPKTKQQKACHHCIRADEGYCKEQCFFAQDLNACIHCCQQYCCLCAGILTPEECCSSAVVCNDSSDPDIGGSYDPADPQDPFNRDVCF